MDDFRAIPQMAEALQDMIAKGQARLATVTAVYPNEVDAQISDGTVARFATTHNRLSIGQKGVLLHGAGGSKIFTPLGLHIPTPLSNGAYMQTTRTTAGTYQHDAAAVTHTGLIPGKVYRALVSMDYIVYSAVAGGGVFKIGFTRTDANATNQWGGTDNIDAASSSAIGFRRMFSFSIAMDCTANSLGEVKHTPAIQWHSGQVHWYWGYITVTLF